MNISSELRQNCFDINKNLLIIKHCLITISHLPEFFDLLCDKSILVLDLCLNLLKQQVYSLAFEGSQIFHGLQKGSLVSRLSNPHFESFALT